ncbi:MAG: cytochrome c oxidase subunit 3 [Cyclobacteriaceae bacterium]
MSENRIDLRLVEEPKKPLAMNPKKFAMWLFLASVMMLFMALTSAYIVRQAEGNWRYFDIPVLFYITSVVIIISSVSMQWTYFSLKKDKKATAKVMMLITIILGIFFLLGQFVGAVQLVDSGIHLVGNPSESFFYLITGLTVVHIVSGVVFLAIMLNAIFKGFAHAGNMTKMEMCTTYWHFLGALWLYLFIFLLLYR